jgi:hypothetical protein
MELAVRTARRGFATAPDILNTLPLAELLTGKTQDHGSRRPARQY